MQRGAQKAAFSMLLAISLLSLAFLVMTLQAPLPGGGGSHAYADEMPGGGLHDMGTAGEGPGGATHGTQGSGGGGGSTPPEGSGESPSGESSEGSSGGSGQGGEQGQGGGSGGGSGGGVGEGAGSPGSGDGMGGGTGSSAGPGTGAGTAPDPPEFELGGFLWILILLAAVGVIVALLALQRRRKAPLQGLGADEAQKGAEGAERAKRVAAHQGVPSGASGDLVAAYVEACAALARTQRPRAITETAGEFAARAPDEAKAPFARLTFLYEAVRHGAWSASRADVAEAQTLAAAVARATTPTSKSGETPLA